jgi:hypothetical protein
MAWARVQSASTSGTASGNALSITLGQAPVTGNKLIVLAVSDSTSAQTFTAADGNSAALTNISGAQQFTDNGQLSGALLIYDVPATPSTTVTVTTSPGGATNIAIYAMEVSGLVSGSTAAACVDGGTFPAASHGGTTTYSGPSYTSTAANEFLIGCFFDNGGPETYSAVNSYTLDTSSAGPPPTSAGINNNSLGDVVIVYKNSTNGSESAPFSLTGTACGWGSFLLAFKISGAGPATTGPALYPEAMQRQPVTVVSNAGWRGANHSL